MGTDSHMIATIITKHLRAIAAGGPVSALAGNSSVQELLKEIVSQLFSRLQQTQSLLQLQPDELMATILLAVLDIPKATAAFICIGDGVIAADGQVYEYDQDNKPDYLGYHLHKTFDTWFAAQKQQLTLTGIRDFAISTDGVYSFSKYDNRLYEETGDALHYLLHDTSGAGSAHMLNGKVIEIEREWGLLPGDDIAIVRVMLNGIGF